MLEKHRDWNVDAGIEWWSSIYEDVARDMEEIGVDVDPRYIYFSGFWCQGDGACFDFRVTNFQKFLAAVDPKLGEIALKIDTTDLEFQGKHSGPGYHSGCMSYETQLIVFNPWTTGDEEGGETNDNPNWLQREAWNLMTGNGCILDDHEQAMKDFIRGKMNELYKTLEREHEYQTSDEQVVEGLLANDMLDEYLEARKEKHKLRCRAFNQLV